MGIVELWTIVAIVLHLCGVGSFAEWEIFASPFSWSCLCLEMWSFIFYAICLVLLLVIKFVAGNR